MNIFLSLFFLFLNFNLCSKINLFKDIKETFLGNEDLKDNNFDYLGLYVGAGLGFLSSKLNKNDLNKDISKFHLSEKIIFNPISSSLDHFTENFIPNLSNNQKYNKIINFITKIERYALAGHFIQAINGDNFKRDLLRLHKQTFRYLINTEKNNSFLKYMGYAALLGGLFRHNLTSYVNKNFSKKEDINPDAMEIEELNSGNNSQEKQEEIKKKKSEEKLEKKEIEKNFKLKEYNDIGSFLENLRMQNPYSAEINKRL